MILILLEVQGKYYCSNDIYNSTISLKICNFVGLGILILEIVWEIFFLNQNKIRVQYGIVEEEKVMQVCILLLQVL